MKKYLSEKLNRNDSYSNEEIDWLISNIGHPDAELRDGLVYASFCHFLLDQLISREQVTDLFQKINSNKLLFFNIEQQGNATLTRSFTALLLALLLHVDNLDTSTYYNFLNKREKQQLFTMAFDYLSKETDYRGYSSENGWIHAISHGAEFLLSAINHQDFPNEQFDVIWNLLVNLFRNQKAVFTAGEERRLAMIITHLIIMNKTTVTQVTEQIKQTTFVDDSPESYFAKLNYDNFLSCIYFQLKSEKCDDSHLNQIIEEQLANSF